MLDVINFLQTYSHNILKCNISFFFDILTRFAHNVKSIRSSNIHGFHLHTCIGYSPLFILCQQLLLSS